MGTHPYRPLGTRDRARISADIEAHLRAWCVLWFPAEQARIEAVDWWQAEASPAGGEWQGGSSNEGMCCALALQEAQRARLLDLLCGGDAAGVGASPGGGLSSLAGALVNACLRDLRTRILGGTDDGGTSDRAPTGRCIAVAIALGPVALRLTLSPELVLTSASGRPETASALTPPAEACARQGVPAVVRLQGAELPLSAVATLRVGDVVRLDHPVDAPCQVHFEGTGVVLRGFLGRRGERRAVKVVEREHS